MSVFFSAGLAWSFPPSKSSSLALSRYLPSWLMSPALSGGGHQPTYEYLTLAGLTGLTGSQVKKTS
jgi:hypothetical protein